MHFQVPTPARALFHSSWSPVATANTQTSKSTSSGLENTNMQGVSKDLELSLLSTSTVSRWPTTVARSNWWTNPSCCVLQATSLLILSQWRPHWLHSHPPVVQPTSPSHSSNLPPAALWCHSSILTLTNISLTFRFHPSPDHEFEFQRWVITLRSQATTVEQPQPHTSLSNSQSASAIWAARVGTALYWDSPHETTNNLNIPFQCSDGRGFPAALPLSCADRTRDIL